MTYVDAGPMPGGSAFENTQLSSSCSPGTVGPCLHVHRLMWRILFLLSRHTPGEQRTCPMLMSVDCTVCVYCMHSLSNGSRCSRIIHGISPRTNLKAICIAAFYVGVGWYCKDSSTPCVNRKRGPKPSVTPLFSESRKNLALSCERLQENRAFPPPASTQRQAPSHYRM